MCVLYSSIQLMLIKKIITFVGRYKTSLVELNLKKYRKTQWQKKR